MRIEKICEYFNEIGILEYENINIFLEIYSKLSYKNYPRIIDRLTDTLIIYFNNNFIKNNSISKLCENILSSFNNYQLISKYRTLNNMKNILMNKIQSNYITFFLKISLYITKNNNRQKKNYVRNSKIPKNPKKIDNLENENFEENNENDKYKEESNELISSDDERECTFKPKINKNFKGYKKPMNNIESRVYYSPAFNIASKFPINKYQNYNLIKNNNINNIINANNIQRNNMNAINYNNPDNSYYSNYTHYNNNLNISNDSRSNRSYNPYDNNTQTIYQKYSNDYISQLNNKYINNDYYNNYDDEILMDYNNPNISDFNNNRNIYNNPNINNINNNRNIYNNYINTNISQNINRSDEFFNKEMNHIQKVKDKIQNMKIEKLNKIKEECTFEPKINTNYKSFHPQNRQLENNIYSQPPPKPQQQPQPPIKPPSSHKVIPMKKNINYVQKMKPKETLETIKENENTNQNSLAPQKKREKIKRSYSEKKKRTKIMEDLSLARKRRTEKTKKLMKERNFTPKAKKNDKYKDQITLTFEERRLKSIALKSKYKNAKKEENLVNNDIILAPSEMVRFKENNLNENENYNNLDLDKKEDIKINNNEDKKENINNIENSNNININNNYNTYDNNKKDIEKNKILLLDRIKGEHKIGFKVKKDDEENEVKENKENNNMNDIINNNKAENNEGNQKEAINTEENDDNLFLKYKEKIENTNNELNFNSEGFHSNALKEILDKNKK